MISKAEITFRFLLQESKPGKLFHGTACKKSPEFQI